MALVYVVAQKVMNEDGTATGELENFWTGTELTALFQDAATFLDIDVARAVVGQLQAQSPNLEFDYAECDQALTLTSTEYTIAPEPAPEPAPA